MSSFSFVQEVYAASGGNQVNSQQLSITNTAGDFMWCVARYISFVAPPAEATITDSNNNTWHEVGSLIDQTSSGGGCTVLWYAMNVAGGANTITLNKPVLGTNYSYYMRMSVVEYSGIVTTNALDAFAIGGTVSTGTGTAVSSATITPGATANGALIVAFDIGFNTASGSTTTTPGAGFTSRGHNGQFDTQDVFEATASANVAVTFTSTFSSSNQWVAGIATFLVTTYSIGGNAGVAGATVSYSGTASGSVTADGSGNYSIVGLGAGSYTITPSKTDYTFSPTSSNQTITSSNITGVNFVATFHQVATTTFSPPGGTYHATQTVSFVNANSALPGFAMYYTTDGSTPTTGSTLYTGPITVSVSGTVVKVLAVATGYANSAVASATYTITPAASLISDFRFRF
jgi:hypothetical protein